MGWKRVGRRDMGRGRSRDLTAVMAGGSDLSASSRVQAWCERKQSASSKLKQMRSEMSRAGSE